MKTNSRHLNKYKRRDGALDSDDFVDSDDIGRGKMPQRRASGNWQGLGKKLKKVKAWERSEKRGEKYF